MIKLQPLAQLAGELPLTKRNILKVIAKVFEPLGLISPVIIEMKVLFQELCKYKVGWDNELPEHLQRKWNAWCAELRKVGFIRNPRCYLHNVDEHVVTHQLHGFCDSSQSGYAAVVYLRVTTEDQCQSELVVSKTRVAPLSKLSIPRLELLSALILARLITNVKSAFEGQITIDKVCCWTDSLTALYWIRGIDKEWRTFVESRVKEIRCLVLPEFWDHCPGSENPADIPSRGMSVTNLAKSQTWFHGPEWLLSSEEYWPSTTLETELESATEELRADKGKTSVLLSTVPSSPSVIDCKRFSSYERLLRVTAYVRRFFHNGQKKNRISGTLSTEEIEQSDSIWIRELQTTLDHKQFDKQLGLFRDDNHILRCRGRLDNADLPYSTRHPAVLPRSHHVTKLIIRHCHENVFHGGLNATLTEVRTKYWITKGRQTVKKKIHKCVICRRFQGQHYPIPPSPDLPNFRVQGERAFTSVGVDFAGPLYVKPECDCKPEMTKVWIALFTCCTSGAVLYI